MSSNYDIEMSLDDTLELDTVIKEDASATNPINKVEHTDDNSTHSVTGIQTKTSIFDPPKSGPYKININGQILSIYVTDPSIVDEELVNDFESQDGISPTTEWGTETNVRNDSTKIDNWNTNNPIVGTASRHLAGDGGGTDYNYTRSSPVQPKEYSVIIKGLRRDGHDGDEARSFIEGSSGNEIVRFELEANGDFRVNETTRTSWILDTAYKMRAYNIDFDDEIFDWEFINYDTDTRLKSGTGESFQNSASDVELVHYGMSNGGSGGTVGALYDNITVSI